MTNPIHDGIEQSTADGYRTLQAELDAIIVRFGADTGTIHLVEDGCLVLKAHSGVPPEVVRIVSSVPIGKGMAGLATQSNKAVFSCNIQVDRSGNVQPGAKRTGVNGAIVVPIRDYAGHAVGALGIGVCREHAYSTEDTASLILEAEKLARLN